jgi:hypothetical protein
MLHIVLFDILTAPRRLVTQMGIYLRWEGISIYMRAHAQACAVVFQLTFTFYLSLDDEVEMLEITADGGARKVNAKKAANGHAGNKKMTEVSHVQPHDLKVAGST